MRLRSRVGVAASLMIVGECRRHAGARRPPLWAPRRLEASPGQREDHSSWLAPGVVARTGHFLRSPKSAKRQSLCRNRHAGRREAALRPPAGAAGRSGRRPLGGGAPLRTARAEGAGSLVRRGARGRPGPLPRSARSPRAEGPVSGQDGLGLDPFPLRWTVCGRFVASRDLEGHGEWRQPGESRQSAVQASRRYVRTGIALESGRGRRLARLARTGAGSDAAVQARTLSTSRDAPAGLAIPPSTRSAEPCNPRPERRRPKSPPRPPGPHRCRELRAGWRGPGALEAPPRSAGPHRRRRLRRGPVDGSIRPSRYAPRAVEGGSRGEAVHARQRRAAG